MVMVNFYLKRSIMFHNALHGFIEGRGAVTAALEAKLAQQLAGILHKPLVQVFLDARKSYDLLDRERCL